MIIPFFVVVCFYGLVWSFILYMHGPRFVKSIPCVSPESEDCRMITRYVVGLLQCRGQSRFICNDRYLTYSDIVGDRHTYAGNVDTWLFNVIFRKYMIPRLLLVRSLSFDDNNDVSEYITRIFYHLFEFTPLKKDHFVLGNKNGELFQLPMFYRQ